MTTFVVATHGPDRYVVIRITQPENEEATYSVYAECTSETQASSVAAALNA